MTLYRREFLDVKNNREDYLFALDLMFKSAVDPDPVLRWMYYSEFGPEEELEKAERDLKILSDIGKGLQRSLEEEHEDSDAVFMDIPAYNCRLTVKRKSL